MDLRGVAPSKNFQDRTGSNKPLRDKIDGFFYRLFFPLLGDKSDPAKDPAVNDQYLKRIKDMGPAQADYSKMTVSDFTPQEWKLIRENGFGLDDIMLLRNHNAPRR